MLSYEFLFDLTLILLSTKLFGLLATKLKLPQVVGALVAGLILGPAILNILNETTFISQLAELGVIVLMFSAGLETDVKELKKVGPSAFIISIFGMIIPIAGGLTLSYFFNRNGLSDASASLTMQHIFMGVILASTSVSITVEVLKELGKLSTKAGNTILGAAIIDDILGIIALTVVTGMSNSEVSIFTVLFKIVLFFIVGGASGFIFSKLMNKLMTHYNMPRRRFIIFSFAFCLFLSFVAEHFFGVADITGAFLAGIVLSHAPRRDYILTRFDTVSYALLSPIFFASIGIKVIIPEMSTSLIIFSVLLVLIAIFGKLIGCGIFAKLAGYTSRESFQISSGMISRGEVTLIVASKGIAMGLLGSVFFGPIVIMVVITTILMPILLKLSFSEKTK